MKKLGWLSAFLIAVVQVGFSQNAFFAVSNGNWNASGVWSTDGVTPLTCAPCVAGTDYPGSIDQAYTQGFSITIPANTSLSVGDLYVAYNIANGITRANLGLACTLTIGGELAGYDPVAFDYAVPTAAVIRNNLSTLILVFDGSVASGPVINSWSTSAPLRVVRFNPASSATTLSIPGFSVADFGTLTVQNGTLALNGTIRAAGSTATITVNTGTTLQLNSGSAINGTGTTSSLFPSIVVNGTLTSVESSTSYINSTSITLAAASALNVGFNGANQTQGWWYQGNSPTTATLNATSTVTYTANAAQNVSASVTYGNLALSSNTGVTKTLSGSGLTIQGNLTVGANVTFSPSTQVDFTGTATQSISGTGTLNFNGGLEVNKSSGMVTLNKATASNGIVVTSGTLSLGDVITTLSAATVSNAGTITSGTAGSLFTSGTTSFTGAGSTTLNNLTISSGTTSFNSSVAITGNLTNSGSASFSATSTVTFSGGNNQTISGNAITLGNMAVNKTSTTLSNNGNVELLRGLTMTTGTFDADGSGAGIFTLNSDANATAYIGAMAGGSITGELTFERYFDNSNNRWRNIGFPVTSVTRAELGSSISLQTNSLGSYTESTFGNVDQGWVLLNSGSLTSRLGYSAYMYNTGALLISVTGPLLKNTAATAGSPYDFQVTYTNDPAQPATEDGWNFVSNPFASPINWKSASGWTKTNVNAAAAMWDTQNNIYQYSNVGWDGVVAQGQAFWVQTNASLPSLTCQEAVKTVVIDPTFYRQRDQLIDSRLMITLKDDLNYDKAVVQFNDNSTAEFDGEFDSYKLKNKIFNLSTLTSQGINLAANTLPAASCASSVKINITNILPGNYTFVFDGVETFSQVEAINLKDHHTNTTVQLSAGKSYSFNVTGDINSFGPDRFELEFSLPEVTKPQITSTDGTLSANTSSNDIQWYMDDELLVGETAKNLRPKLNGTYTFASMDKGCSLLSSKFVFEGNKSKVFPNPVTSSHGKFTVDVHGYVSTAGRSGTIRVYSSLGEVVREQRFSKDDSAVDFEVNGLRPGQYMIMVMDEAYRVMSNEKIIVIK
jgi:hypothetical protein